MLAQHPDMADAGSTQTLDLPTSDDPGRRENFQPRSAGQEVLCETINTNDIIFAVGPAGSGKSVVAVAKAVEAFEAGRITKIALYRPYRGVGPEMGFEPGDRDAKIFPYLAHLIEAFAEFLPEARVTAMCRDATLVMGAFSHIRGHTFKRTFAILDEAQNATFAELKVFLNRIGEGSKLIICGDLTPSEDANGHEQSDLPVRDQGALSLLSARYLAIPGIARVELTEIDIVRHPLVRAMAAVDRASREARRN